MGSMKTPFLLAGFAFDLRSSPVRNGVLSLSIGTNDRSSKLISPLNFVYKYLVMPQCSTPVPQMSSLAPMLIAGTSFSFSMGETLGAIYIGATISAIFYGITILQTAVYFKLNPNDPWLFRYTVALLWILDTLHVALTTHALYFYLIKSFGNYFALLTVIWYVSHRPGHPF